MKKKPARSFIADKYGDDWEPPKQESLQHRVKLHYVQVEVDHVLYGCSEVREIEIHSDKIYINDQERSAYKALIEILGIDPK
jgi:hypothetical protein